MILSAGEPLVTIDHVLIETWTLIRNRLGRRAAERFWEALRDGVSTIETVVAADPETTWEIVVWYRDQDFCIVDRTSFAAMRRLGIERGLMRRRFCELPLRPESAAIFCGRSLKTHSGATPHFVVNWKQSALLR